MIVDVETPHGASARFVCREETSDADLVRAVVGGDEYSLRGRDLQGWAIDVGAHIGTAAITLALDFPSLHVVAIEPVPESREVLRRNIALNDLRSRVLVDERAAAGPHDHADVRVSYGYDDAHRYVGNLHAEGATRFVVTDPVSLTSVLDSYRIDDASLLKIDCEGCEWSFLSDPTVARVREIVGEVHGAGDEFDRVEALLAATHHVRVDRPKYLFQAVLR